MGRKAVRPRSFHTANGMAITDKVARMTVNEFGEEVAPYILDSTPAVLSVGYRCMNQGYSFIWPKGGEPVRPIAQWQSLSVGDKGSCTGSLPWHTAEQAEGLDEDEMICFYM